MQHFNPRLKGLMNDTVTLARFILSYLEKTLVRRKKPGWRQQQHLNKLTRTLVSSQKPGWRQQQKQTNKWTWNQGFLGGCPGETTGHGFTGVAGRATTVLGYPSTVPHQEESHQWTNQQDGLVVDPLIVSTPVVQNALNCVNHILASTPPCTYTDTTSTGVDKPDVPDNHQQSFSWKGGRPCSQLGTDNSGPDNSGPMS